MRRRTPWLVLLVLIGAAAWLLREEDSSSSAPGHARPQVDAGDDPLALIGRGVAMGSREPGSVAGGPDLSDLGDDDPPVEIVVLDDQGMPIPQARIVVTSSRLGTRFEPEQKGPLQLGRRWMRAGAELRVESVVDAAGKALPFRPLVVRLKDSDAPRLDLHLDRGRDLEVRVVDGAGMPIARASVHVTSADPAVDTRSVFWNTSTWTPTGRDGIATFLRLPRIDLVVTVEGDVEEEESLARSEVAASRSQVTLQVDTGPVIEGRVLDPSGMPVTTRVVARAWVRGDDVEWRDDTGPDGLFLLRGMPADAEVRLRALSPDKDRWCTVERRDVRPGVRNVELRLEAAVAIRGEVVDAAARRQGTWEWGVDVTALDGSEVDAGWERPDVARPGVFVVGGLPPGRYRLEAFDLDGSARSRPVEVNAPAEGVRLLIETAPKIVGRVEGTRGARYDAWWTTPTRKASGRVNPDGTFEIPDVKDEAGTLYVGSLSTEKYALRTGVRPGSVPLELTLVDGQRVSGRVEIAGDAHPGLVYVVLAAEGFELWEEMAKDRTFSVLGVPPGSYEVSLAVNEVRGSTLQRVRAGAADVVLAYSPPR